MWASIKRDSGAGYAIKVMGRRRVVGKKAESLTLTLTQTITLNLTLTLTPILTREEGGEPSPVRAALHAAGRFQLNPTLTLTTAGRLQLNPNPNPNYSRSPPA